MSKLTLAEFRERHNNSPLDDDDYAREIVQSLPADLPVVKASRAFLDACNAFDVAMQAAGLQRG